MGVSGSLHTCARRSAASCAAAYAALSALSAGSRWANTAGAAAKLTSTAQRSHPFIPPSGRANSTPLGTGGHSSDMRDIGVPSGSPAQSPEDCAQFTIPIASTRLGVCQSPWGSTASCSNRRRPQARRSRVNAPYRFPWTDETARAALSSSMARSEQAHAQGYRSFGDGNAPPNSSSLMSCEKIAAPGAGSYNAGSAASSAARSRLATRTV